MKKGSLMIISDACFSGAWCAFYSWLYVEYKGFLDTRNLVDKENRYEPLDRVFIQAASGRRWEAYDAVFAKWLVEAQLDGVGDESDNARSPYRLPSQGDTGSTCRLRRFGKALHRRDTAGGRTRR